MPKLKLGDLEKRVRDLGFSRRKARKAVQTTFDVMRKWLAKDRYMPLELGSGESRELCGEFKVRPQLRKPRTTFRKRLRLRALNVIYRKPWQIVWRACTKDGSKTRH